MVKSKIQKVNYLDFSREIKSRGKMYLSAVERVLNSASYILGNEVLGFEKDFAGYLGIQCCVGVANGLEAIQIALMTLGIGMRDEVITTPVSAVATTLAILAVGAKPIFVDINVNGQIDVNLIEKVITKKTKAILPVDLYGQPSELNKIKTLCKKHNLFLIEDACQAHGATYKNRKLGTYGDIGCFSFYPTKNLGAFGDAGALVTNNKTLAGKARQLRDYGQESKYLHTIYGLNSRLDEIHAAILKAKLNYLDNDNKTRSNIAKRYVKNLEKINDLQIVLPNVIDDSNFHLFVIKTKKRDDLRKFLADNGISTAVHYPLTIPQQPVIKNMKLEIHKLPESERFVNQILSLPCNPFLTLHEVDYVSKKIMDFFNCN